MQAPVEELQPLAHVVVLQPEQEDPLHVVLPGHETLVVAFEHIVPPARQFMVWLVPLHPERVVQAPPPYRTSQVATPEHVLWFAQFATFGVSPQPPAALHVRVYEVYSAGPVHEGRRDPQRVVVAVPVESQEVALAQSGACEVCDRIPAQKSARVAQAVVRGVVPHPVLSLHVRV